MYRAIPLRAAQFAVCGEEFSRRLRYPFTEVKKMDQVRIGAFIALLRKQKGLTQEALGEKLGVTNKTVSRWENGNCMPDIEMLQLLSGLFGVSINELLSGQRLSDGEFRKKADENIIAAAKPGIFSFEERKAYFKRKWLKDHVSLLVLLGLIFLAALAIPIYTNKAGLLGIAGLTAIAEYGYANNRMMIYVEKQLFG